MTELKMGDLVARIPIVQGGMGVGVSLAGLASAVAEEGGVGVIAAAMIGIQEPDIRSNFKEASERALRREIRAARARTTGVLGVNVMVALSNFADMVRTSIEEGIDVIFSGAGLPLNLPAFLTPGCKTKLAPIVSSGRAAALLCKKWLAKYGYLPDAFVVEGPLAGGHLGFKAEQLDDPAFCLERLVADTIEAVKPFEEKKGAAIPVIAAGGVYTGADIRRFLDMGAAGVQLGTRFVATHECDADQAFKDSYIQARGPEDLAIIKSPVGMPGRAIRNEFVIQAEQGGKTPFSCPYHCVVTCEPEKSPYCIALALLNAKLGRLKRGFAFAGANAWRVEKIVSVRELMRELVNEYEAAAQT